MRPETPLRQLLSNDFWGRPIDSQTSVKSYRPLTVLSFRWNFALHGLDVRGYHIANLLLHAAFFLLAILPWYVYLGVRHANSGETERSLVDMSTMVRRER